MASTIRSIRAEPLPDSRGAPTLRVTMQTDKAEGSASIPAGASVGSHEATALPAATAISNVNGEMATTLVGKSFDQRSLDTFLCALDGTPNKARLGGNAILGVSLAFSRAAARETGVTLYTYFAALAGAQSTLPCPMFNIINGGKHAENGLDIQEFMVVPRGIAGTAAQVSAGQACVSVLRELLDARGMGTAMGDEGGFAPHLPNNEMALELLVEARSKAGFTADEIRFSLDAAASSFKKDNGYEFKAGGGAMSAGELSDYWVKLAGRYNLLSLEDPFAEDEQENFAALALKIRAVIIGDDNTVTSTARIEAAAAAKAIGGVILKPNQVGTVSEAIDAGTAAKRLGLVRIASHRSGETPDDWIADFAVGVACEYFKAGAPTRPERMAKYNRLMIISNELTA